MQHKETFTERWLLLLGSLSAAFLILLPSCRDRVGGGSGDAGLPPGDGTLDRGDSEGQADSGEGQQDAGMEDGGWVPLERGKYRTQSTHLFQPIPPDCMPERIPGGGPFCWDGEGPTGRYVDRRTGWLWDNELGDYIDAQGVRQGPEPWFTFQADGASGGDATADYEVDVTDALRFIQANDRWCAFLLKSEAPRPISGKYGDSPPVLVVQYESGETVTMQPWVTAGLTLGSALSTQRHTKQSLPAVIEYDRPTGPVSKATLRLRVLGHFSGDPTVNGFIVDPPINDAPVQNGIAAQAGPLDEGIDENDAVLGVHRYTDSSVLEDFWYEPDRGFSFNAETAFDPAIYRGGEPDHTKFPHVGQGKWVGASPNQAELVYSDYRGDGFEPLAPGLGALRWDMPAAEGLEDGYVQRDYGGGSGANAKIFMPEPLFGRLSHIFVRYYLRLGTPYVTPKSKRYQVIKGGEDGPIAWVDMAGKTGIMPGHPTTYGGVSGTSGGPYGWQMRLSWSDLDTELGGPDENAIAIGLHTWDFLHNNDPFPYGATDKPKDRLFGQRGGLGGIIYPGKWYCIEVEMKLNTVMEESPGYLEDGEIRAWIDGRLVFERTGMVIRMLPIPHYDFNIYAIPPIRELGVRELWFNWYHGGTTYNSIDRVVFTTGLVWATEYIGPMKLD